MIQLTVLYGHPQDPAAFDSHYQRRMLRWRERYLASEALQSPGQHRSHRRSNRLIT